MYPKFVAFLAYINSCPETLDEERVSAGIKASNYIFQLISFEKICTNLIHNTESYLFDNSHNDREIYLYESFKQLTKTRIGTINNFILYITHLLKEIRQISQPCN